MLHGIQARAMKIDLKKQQKPHVFRSSWCDFYIVQKVKIAASVWIHQ